MKNMFRRIVWVIFMPIWILISVTLVIPGLYWIITGKDWFDPEIVYNKLIIGH